jgi:hypothetical protein
VRREPPDDLAPFRQVEGDRDRALAAVAHLVQRADAVDLHADPAPDVTDARALDLHDVGALVGEHRAGIWPGGRDREVEHLDALQGPLTDHGHSSNSSRVRGRPPGPL